MLKLASKFLLLPVFTYLYIGKYPYMPPPKKVLIIIVRST